MNANTVGVNCTRWRCASCVGFVDVGLSCEQILPGSMIVSLIEVGVLIFIFSNVFMCLLLKLLNDIHFLILAAVAKIQTFSFVEKALDTALNEQ